MRHATYLAEEHLKLCLVETRGERLGECLEHTLQALEVPCRGEAARAVAVRWHIRARAPMRHGSHGLRHVQAIFF